MCQVLCGSPKLTAVYGTNAFGKRSTVLISVENTAAASAEDVDD
jgi:hypothetical protein